MVHFSKLTEKFVLLVVVILSVTLGVSAKIDLSDQQQRVERQLMERGRILSHFASQVSVEAILSFDFMALENYVRDVSGRQDIVFSVILDPQGRLLTNYIDKDSEEVRRLMGGKRPDSVLGVLSAAEASPTIIVERFPIIEGERLLGNFILGMSRERLERQLRDNLNRQVMLYSAIILFLSIALYFVFRFNVLKPIHELVLGSQRVASGDYNEPIKVAAKDELGLLTEAFNNMMHEVNQSHERLSLQANFDELTGLPNRKQVIEQLKHEIIRAQRTNTRFAVIFIDMNDFKDVNDSMGHQAGDQLLIAMSQRFTSVLRDSDTLARLGGDEFLLLLPTTGDVELVKEAAQRLLSSIHAPIRVEGREFYLHCSMGVALYPDDGETCAELMANADNAMYEAKKSRTEDIHFYTQAIYQQVKDKVAMEQDLHQALGNGEFDLHFQPVIDAVTLQPVGAEVLLRWHHPEKNNIPPVRFIPMAEATGMIVNIGEWVLRAAAAECERLISKGLSPGYFAVNVSRLQLTEDFPSMVSTILHERGLSPEYLHLEVTESAVMGSYDEIRKVLVQVSEQGVQLSLDDFGTDFSSLNVLKHFPFNTLKVDKSFIDGVPDDENDTSLVRGIIAMSRSLGLRIVAEGVETDEQYRFLLGSSVDNIQGYLFARPMPRDEYEAYLLEYSHAKTEAG